MKKMQISKVDVRVTVQAGEYYLGDPCYTVPDHLWHKLLDSANYFEANTPIGTVEGHEVLAFSTKYGDGTYRDQQGVKYPVDAGLIGLVPVELVEKTEGDAAKKSGCSRIIKFDRAVTCYSDDGVLHFGDYVIDTRGSDDNLFDDDEENFDES